MSDKNKDVVAEIKETLDGYGETLDQIQASQKATDEKVAELTTLADRARMPQGANGPDELKNAIPENNRGLINAHLCRGLSQEDAIREAGKDVWMKTAVSTFNPANARKAAELYERLASMDKAMAGSFSKALQEDSNTEGGYLVPAPIAAELMQKEQDQSILMQFARRIPMNSKTISIPFRDGHTTAYIVAEEGTITASDQSFTQRQITAKKFTGRTILSMELLEDAVLPVASLIADDASKQIARKLDSEGFNGDGTHFTGVGAASNVNTYSFNGTPTWAGLVQVYFKAGTNGSRRNAIFVMHHDAVSQFLQVSGTDGRPVFELGGPAYRSAEGDGSLISKPLYTTDVIASGTAFFGPMDSVAVGERSGYIIGVSEHVNWSTGQIDVRVIKRAGLVVANPGNLVAFSGIYS